MSHQGPAVGQGKVGDIVRADDAALVHSITQGDRTALHTLYDLYGPRCFGLALRLLSQDHGAAEDVVQDVFVRVWQSPHTVEIERGTARSWILASTRTACLDRIRHRARRPSPDFGIAGADVLDSAVDWHQVIQRLTQDDVRAALHGLPHDQTVALERAFFDGFTCAEIADCTGGPVGTVKGSIRLGLRTLRHVLME